MKPTAQAPIELYDLKADEITAHILGYLRTKGFVAWAQDNRGRYQYKTGKWYPHPNNRVGVPDIIGYRKSDARFIGVEVKAGKDRLSQHQIDFLDELKQHGGLPLVAFDFAGFVQSFERRGLHLPMATTAAPAEVVPAGCGGCPRPSPNCLPRAATPSPDAGVPPPPTSLPGLTTTYDEPAAYRHD